MSTAQLGGSSHDRERSPPTSSPAGENPERCSLSLSLYVPLRDTPTMYAKYFSSPSQSSLACTSVPALKTEWLLGQCRISSYMYVRTSLPSVGALREKRICSVQKKGKVARCRSTMERGNVSRHSRCDDCDAIMSISRMRRASEL